MSKSSHLLAEVIYRHCVHFLVAWYVSKLLRRLRKNTNQLHLSFILNLVKLFLKYLYNSINPAWKPYTKIKILEKSVLKLLLVINSYKLSKILNFLWLVLGLSVANCWKILLWLDWAQDKKVKLYWQILIILKTRILTGSSFSGKNISLSRKVEQPLKPLS